MSWVKSTISSVWGAIGLQPVAGPTEFENRLEDIRENMIEALGDPSGAANPGLFRRIQFATDAEGLWYLRSAWMAALSDVQGEAAAAAHVRRLNTMFEGLLPGGLQSRPSSLMG